MALKYASAWAAKPRRLYFWFGTRTICVVLPAHVQGPHADSGRGVGQLAYRYVDDLATVWCEWAEMELRHKQFRRALDLMRRATAAPELLTRRQARQPALAHAVVEHDCHWLARMARRSGSVSTRCVLANVYWHCHLQAIIKLRCK